MAELGTAYVRIIPSAKGISGKISEALKGESVSAGKESGTNIASNLVGTATKIIAAAGIGKVVMSSMMQGAALEQSIGGIKTLFGDYSDEMIQYANRAYETAGVSANKYMEQVTSFSASLLHSLDGDTKAAGEAANQAIIDMSDNANKMGTSMESIQNAYQGFAKQNYTMLDNLKLGYGGTKTEMQRLLKEANRINAENGKITDYQIDNLADVYDAIHVIQEDLGITGTTALEAATTFSGSMAAMKSSATNLLGAIAMGDDISDEILALAGTVRTFVVDNAIPMIMNIVTSIPKALESGIPIIADVASELISNFSTSMIDQAPTLIETAGETISAFLEGITEKLPEFLDTGIEIIKQIADGILTNLPAIITAVGNILNSFVEFIMTNLPMILEKGAELISYLANGISQNMPAILSAIGNVLMNLLQTIIAHLPQLLQAGIRLITSLVSGMLQILGPVRSAANNLAQSALSSLLNFVGRMLSAGARWISSVISGLVSGAGNLISAAGSVARQALNSFLSTNWASVGSNIISGIVSGLWGAAGSLFNSLRNIASEALSAAKSILKIGSPSKVFRDEVGQWIPEGIAVGIEMNADAVDDAVAELANPSAFNMQTYSPAPASTQSNQTMPNMTINVYPSEGMDERKLADYVAQSIYKEVRRRGVAFA